MVITRRVLNLNYPPPRRGPYNFGFLPTGNLCEPQTDADAMETLGRLDGLVSGQRYRHGRRIYVSKGKYNIMLHNYILYILYLY